jgi:hypothetical protein
MPNLRRANDGNVAVSGGMLDAPGAPKSAAATLSDRSVNLPPED